MTYEEMLLEVRYRCMTDRHPGCTYNPWSDKTWCRCGAVIRQGDCSSLRSPYEEAEYLASRSGEVGEEARRFLDSVHGRLPGPAVVPSDAGDQFVLEVEA